jgi:hypothetical protein
MNLKNINDLDPKLKETYERVMGTSLAGSNPTTPPTMETQPVSQPQPESQPEPQAQPQPQSEAPTPIPTEGSTVSQVFRADDAAKSVETATVNLPSKNEATAKKDGKKLLPIIIVIGSVVFFAVYTVIWAKVLGLF